MIKQTLILCVAWIGLAGQAAAQTTNGDPRAGKKLADKACMACHISMFGGDGSKIYTRADRKVKNMRQLQSQVRTCNTNVGAGWLPEEEAHVAAYLNETYYRF